MIDRVPARRLADMSHYDLEKINWAVAVLTRLAFGQIPVAHSQILEKIAGSPTAGFGDVARRSVLRHRFTEEGLTEAHTAYWFSSSPGRWPGCLTSGLSASVVALVGFAFGAGIRKLVGR